jgi:hypothetical protein
MARNSIVLLTVVGLLMLSGCGGGGVEGDLDKLEKCIKDGDLEEATELVAELAKQVEDMTDEQKAEFQKLQEEFLKAQADAAGEAIGDVLGGD